MLQLTKIETTSNRLCFQIHQKHGKVSPNCSLTVVTIDHDTDTEIERKVYYPPFPNTGEVVGLPPSKLIQIKYTFVNGNNNKTNNVFTFTKAEDQHRQEQEDGPLEAQHSSHVEERPSSNYKSKLKSKESARLSNTEGLIRSVAKINNVMTDKELDRAMLAARNSKNTVDFVNSGYKNLRPQLRQSRLKRTMLISHGIQVCDTIYKYSEGRNLFQNDWFMGPFYSYDNNERQMTRKL